ncbi:MAG: putative transrane protein, partial [Frankiales bacterium]|nr:putative transrane protein [Frankiales bacterium]
MWSTPAARPGVRASIRAVRLMAVSIVGGLLLVAGLAALVLPGPGMLLCILGLVLLASEYAWAQRSLHWAR